MSVYIDRKFLGFVSSRLEQYKQKQTDLYNFRCPYCGDSQKNKLKARGYVYRKSNDYFLCAKSIAKELQAMMDELRVDLLQEIKALREVMAEQHDVEKRKIDDLNKWRWLS